jgi:hypothetical protein
MKIYFDTEFIEDGNTIDLMSIGMVREDGLTYYAELAECDLTRADEWVQKNVIPHLLGGKWRMSRATVKSDLLAFAGEAPQFWAYYASYDWVALAQLFGRMIDLPSHWPMHPMDLQQMRVERGIAHLPEQTGIAHHALNDALWTRDAHEWLLRQTVPASGGAQAATGTAE